MGAINSRIICAAVVLVAVGLSMPAAGQTAVAVKGDAANGEKVFSQCKLCHVVEQDVNRVGPSLFGVVGRKAGAVPGYKYSAASLKSGLVWNEATLAQYLEAPMKFMPGTKMAFAGLKKPQDRADVIAYLATKK